MTLRTRLFVAIAAVAALSVAVAFTVGAFLSRRTVERNSARYSDACSFSSSPPA